MILRTLLLVDGDPAVGPGLRDALRSWRIVDAADRPSALEAVAATRPSVAAVSLAGAGMAVLEGILGAAPEVKVVMLDGQGDRGTAARAVALGAHDVVEHGAGPAELALAIERAYRRFGLEQEGRRLAADAPPTLRAVRDAAERRAVLDALARVGGNLSAAARLLEVSRPTLYNLLRQHGIRTP